MFEINIDATYPDKDRDILDPDALFEFMILSSWDKAERDRFAEFWYKWSILPRPLVYDEENNPDGLMFQMKYHGILTSGSSFNIGYTIGLM
jgi:hypothetical protein